MEKKSVKWVLLGIGIVVVAMLIFQAGVFVGMKKGGYSDHLDFFHDRVPGGNGVAGKVISIAYPTVIIEGSDNIEKKILVDDDTLIREDRDSLSTSSIKVDDMIIVLGSPDPAGQVLAKLIRVLPPPTDASLLSSSTNPNY